jgi:hypothetical protein
MVDNVTVDRREVSRDGKRWANLGYVCIVLQAWLLAMLDIWTLSLEYYLLTF